MVVKSVANHASNEVKNGINALNNYSKTRARVILYYPVLPYPIPFATYLQQAPPHPLQPQRLR